MTDIIARLRSRSPYLDGSSATRVMEEAAAEIERLRLTFASRQETGVDRNTPEQAYLQIVEGWLRNNRDIHFPKGAVDDLCERISRRTLEHKV